MFPRNEGIPRVPDDNMFSSVIFAMDLRRIEPVVRQAVTLSEYIVDFVKFALAPAGLR